MELLGVILESAAIEIALILPTFFLVAQAIFPGKAIQTPNIWMGGVVPNTTCAVALPDFSPSRWLVASRAPSLATAVAASPESVIVASLPICAITLGTALIAIATNLLVFGPSRRTYRLAILLLVKNCQSWVCYAVWMYWLGIPLPTVKWVCGSTLL
ncbi:hypothetical protein PG996_007584 [Apiospora saccharicola]|uniref:Uncharacterized protein n=1 Tax=Apiospora saccharicola TaxID=335842 RepID=A0ABR1VB86_9PEZI